MKSKFDVKIEGRARRSIRKPVPGGKALQRLFAYLISKAAHGSKASLGFSYVPALSSLLAFQGVSVPDADRVDQRAGEQQAGPDEHREMKRRRRCITNDRDQMRISRRVERAHLAAESRGRDVHSRQT